MDQHQNFQDTDQYFFMQTKIFFDADQLLKVQARISKMQTNVS